LKAPSQNIEFFQNESSPDTANESQVLLSSLADGDASAFWKLWERHRAHLYAICFQFFRKNSHEAEDALSEAMLKAVEKMPQFAGSITDPRAWLARFTYNHCIDLHRRNRLRRHDTTEDKNIENNLETEISPETSLFEHETQDHLNRLVNALPKTLREAFALRFIHEISYEDIASRLNLSPASVRKRIQRARIFLKRHLKWERKSDGPNGGAFISGDAGGMHPPKTDVSQELKKTENQANRARLRFFSIRQSSGADADAYLLVKENLLKSRVRLPALRRYVERHATGWRKRLTLAHLSYASGRMFESATEYRLITERQPRSVESWLQLGHVLNLLGRNREAMETYEALLSNVSDPALRHHVQGLIQAHQGNFETAIAELRRAAVISPSESAHWHTLGVVHLHADQDEKAFESFQTGLRLNPSDTASLTYSCDALMRLNRPIEAMRRLCEALESDDENVLALKRVADLRCQRRLTFGSEGALTRRILRKMENLAPDAADVRESVAFYCIARGEWSAGTEILEDYVRRRPKNSNGWKHLAIWLFRTGNVHQSAQAILRAHALSPYDPAICQTACEVLCETSLGSELEKILSLMIERFPERWSAWSAAGYATVRGVGNFEKGCAFSAQSLRLQPKLAASWLQHGGVLSLAGKMHKAIASFQEGWRLLPDNEVSSQAIWSAIQLGVCLRFVGDEASAQEWLHRAVGLAKSFVSFHPSLGWYFHGRTYDLLGDQKTAASSYAQALRNHVSYPARRDLLLRFSDAKSSAPSIKSSFPSVNVVGDEIRVEQRDVHSLNV
jgi:RNA polymerase sigma factor (sigma-70 family)